MMLVVVLLEALKQIWNKIIVIYSSSKRGILDSFLLNNQLNGDLQDTGRINIGCAMRKRQDYKEQ